VQTSTKENPDCQVAAGLAFSHGPGQVAGLLSRELANPQVVVIADSAATVGRSCMHPKLAT
jgi:hypothetical protein